MFYAFFVCKSSFADLNSAGARGITFEQAANDIKLSGDIRQIGEVSARIAITDGLLQYNGKKKYAKDIYDDIYYPKTPREQSAFNRSLANKTSGLKEGETKRIIINTADNFYVVDADGYLSGNIEIVLRIDDNIDLINSITEEIRNVDSTTEGFDSWTENLRNGRGGNNSSNVGNGYRRKANTFNGLDGNKFESDIFRSVGANGKNYQKGKVTVASGVKLSKGEKAILSKIAKDSGVAVVVERFSGADAASKGFYSGGIVHLNADRLSEGGFTYTGIHEVVHHLKAVNTEGYKAIESFVKNYYKEKGADLDSEVAKTQAYYKSKGVELTPEEAMEEIVCNTLSDIATDEDALSAFLGLDSKSQNKLIEVIKTLVRKLKEWANKYLKNTEYHSIVMNDADTLLHLAKQLRAELTKSGQKNYTAEDGGVKYNLNENARAEVHKALYDRSYNGEVILRDNTPSIMLAQKGVRDLPMVMKVSHIRENIFTEAEARQQGLKVNKNINYHGLGEDLFLNVLDGLDDVTEAYRGTKLADNSSRRENYFLLISNFTDADGNIINVPVYIEETALSNNVFFDTNKISTVYGKEKLREYIQRQIRDKNLVRIKNRSNVSSESNAPIAEDYRNIASEDSIYKNAKDVNSNSLASFDKNYLSAVESGDMDTAQRFVDEAAEEAMKNSKIRDESGKLAKVYHGSESDDFYEFDKARRGQTDTVSGKDNKKAVFSRPPTL